jgi:hypothetical protein
MKKVSNFQRAHVGFMKPSSATAEKTTAAVIATLDADIEAFFKKGGTVETIPPAAADRDFDDSDNKPLGSYQRGESHEQ